MWRISNAPVSVEMLTERESDSLFSSEIAPGRTSERLRRLGALAKVGEYPSK